MLDLNANSQRTIDAPAAVVSAIDITMVQIKGGTFLMGSDYHPVELPVHQVSIGSFFMSEFVITQAQWRAVAALPKVECDLNPSPLSGAEERLVGDCLPIINVSWYDAQEFCARLSAATGRNYRLPTEAEWEYACRARTTTLYSFGDEITQERANYAGGTDEGLTPKGKYPPNAYGLYDMHGNVWEMCQDIMHRDYNGAPSDGSAWMNENQEQCVLDGNQEQCVLRGGGRQFEADRCRSAARCCLPLNAKIGHTGFRVVYS